MNFNGFFCKFLFAYFTFLANSHFLRVWSFFLCFLLFFFSPGNSHFLLGAFIHLERIPILAPNLSKAKVFFWVFGQWISYVEKLCCMMKNFTQRWKFYSIINKNCTSRGACEGAYMHLAFSVIFVFLLCFCCVFVASRFSGSALCPPPRGHTILHTILIGGCVWWGCQTVSNMPSNIGWCTPKYTPLFQFPLVLNQLF